MKVFCTLTREQATLYEAVRAQTRWSRSRRPRACSGAGTSWPR